MWFMLPFSASNVLHRPNPLSTLSAFSIEIYFDQTVTNTIKFIAVFFFPLKAFSWLHILSRFLRRPNTTLFQLFSEKFIQGCWLDRKEACSLHISVISSPLFCKDRRLPLMRILNAAVIALEIISDIAAKWLFAQEDVINIERTRHGPDHALFYLIACDSVTIASQWTVSDENPSARETRDVSIIWAAPRSTTYDRHGRWEH